MALASAAHHAGAQPAVERELIQLERDWDAAFHHTAFIDRVLAPEFVATYPDGSRGDRAKELANAAAFNQQIDPSTLDEFKRRSTGTLRPAAVPAAGGSEQSLRLEIVHRYLDVFVRRDGKWLRGHAASGCRNEAARGVLTMRIARVFELGGPCLPGVAGRAGAGAGACIVRAGGSGSSCAARPGPRTWSRCRAHGG